MRMSGNVHPRVPRSAPLALRLPAEVYALDGDDYFVTPGARLEVSRKGKLYETMGSTGALGQHGLIAGVAAAGVVWWMFFRKKGRKR